jgi:DNA-binding response OmpR family regulator
MIRTSLAHAVPQVALLFTTGWKEAAVSDALHADGMAALHCANALALVHAVQSSKAHIALVEDQGINLPGCLTTLRFRGVTTMPVVAVGGGSADEMARALRHGAADYAVFGEAAAALVNRVRARLDQACHQEAPASLQAGAFLLDEPSRTLRHPCGALHLTTREFALAWMLFEHTGRVVNMNTLAQQVWGRDSSVAKRTIEQHVSKLRRKLAAAYGGTRDVPRLQAIQNIGYRLVVEQRAADDVCAQAELRPRCGQQRHDTA